MCGCESAAAGFVECSRRKTFLWQIDGAPYRGIIDCDAIHEHFVKVAQVCPDCRYKSKYVARAMHKISNRMRTWTNELLNSCNRELALPANISGPVDNPHTPLSEPARERHMVALKAAISASRMGQDPNFTYNAVLDSAVVDQQVDERFTNPRPVPMPVSSHSECQQPMVHREDIISQVSTTGKTREITIQYRNFCPSGTESELANSDTWKTSHPTLGTPGLAL